MLPEMFQVVKKAVLGVLQTAVDSSGSGHCLYLRVKGACVGFLSPAVLWQGIYASAGLHLGAWTQP